VCSRSGRYGVVLEQQTFAGRTADFVWMIMLGMLTLLPLPLIIPSLEAGPHAASRPGAYTCPLLSSI